MEEVRDIVTEHVETDVYDVYAPTIYKRRSMGGLSDERNIVGTVNNKKLTVENETAFAQGYHSENFGKGLATLVNDGDGAGGFYYDYAGEFNEPRPFWDNAVEEIETTNRVENALVDGLRRLGNDVK